MRGRGDAHLDAGIGVLERGHAGHQPFGGERGGGADGQQPVAIGAAQPGGGAAQVLERAAHRRQVGLRLACQLQRAVAAHEQGDAELLLQPADQVADRGLGDVQLVRGAGEAEMARRRLEGAQAVQRGQGRHGAQLSMTLSHVKADKVSFVGRRAMATYLQSDQRIEE